MVKGGTYTENVSISKSGTASAPIWLISADGNGAAKIVPASSSKDTIKMNGQENLVIQGFDVTEPSGDYYGIKVSMNSFTDLVKNVVIINNYVHGNGNDGIKVSQGDRIYILNNVVDGATDQGIDLVAVNDSLVSGNEVRNVRGSAGIQVKGGSTNVVVSNNVIHAIAEDGLHIGGGTDDGSMRPGYTSYEAKNITVTGNRIYDVGNLAVWFMGAQDSKFQGNTVYDIDGKDVRLIASTVHDSVINTKNITITGNSFDNANWLVVESGQGSGLTASANLTDGSALPTGSTGTTSGTGSTSGTDTTTGGDTDTGTNDTVSSGSGTGSSNSDDQMATDSSRRVETLDSDDRTLTLDGGSDDGVGNALANKITGNGDNNLLLGMAGNDTIYGNGDNDTLDGGTGADSMAGGTGGDLYLVDNAGDRVVEYSGSGTDTVRSSVAYTLPSHVENLVLAGEADSGTGNDLRNTITGNEDGDSLKGQGGNDTLIGSGGRDSLAGGSGADVFKYLGAGDSGPSSAARDLISDFSRSSGDRIDLTAIDAKTGTSGDQAFSFIGTSGFSGAQGQLRYTQTSSRTVIEGDVNGDRAPDFQIELSGQYSLDNSAFLL